MSFLNRLLDVANAAKDILEDIQSMSNDTAHSDRVDGNMPGEEEGNDAASCTIPDTSGISARRVTGAYYDSDDSGADHEISMSFEVPYEYHEFDIGDAVADLSYIYSPEIQDPDEYGIWKKGVPYIFLGNLGDAFDIVKQYEDRGSVPVRASLKKIKHPIAKYRTTHVCNGNYYVCYHYQRRESNVYSQMAAVYPVSIKGTAREKDILSALDHAINTYREEIIK